MAHHQNPCEICDRIAKIQRGEDPLFVDELPTGYVVLGDNQYFRGYTLFLCKHPAPDLEDLPREVRARFVDEMMLVSEVVSKVVKPHKMNLESLGNVVPHLHWHLFPRQVMETDPLKPVWLVQPSEADALEWAFDPERDGELIIQLRRELAKVQEEK
jgi:diadenosine tetraphosphate (Ap4A) HIT family hydrolase